MTRLTLTARQRLTTYASLSHLQSDEETYDMINYDELVQRLREQYMDTKQMLPNVLCHDSADAITKLRAERDALRADAMRYCFLRGDVPNQSARWSRWRIEHWASPGPTWSDLRGPDLDAAVDAALRHDIERHVAICAKQATEIEALRALLKVAQDCIYSLDAREIYADELARIDAALKVKP